MTDEYLKRCRELADVKPKPDDGLDVPEFLKNDPPTVHTSPAYIKLLTYAENLKNQEAYLLARLKFNDENRIPVELFDGFAVLKNVNENAVEGSILAGTVSDVLDAVVRMIRERLGQ